MKPWKRIEPTKITKVGWRTIVSKTFVRNDGKQVVYDTIAPENIQCIDVIAITPRNTIVISEQFRPGPEKVVWDAPGGIVDEGEELEAAAHRELQEETGYTTPYKMKYLGYFYKDPNVNATWHTFIAYDCEKTTTQSLDDDEEINVIEASISDFIESARNGNTVSSHVPVLMAYETLRELEKRGNEKTN